MTLHINKPISAIESNIKIDVDYNRDLVTFTYNDGVVCVQRVEEYAVGANHTDEIIERIVHTVQNKYSELEKYRELERNDDIMKQTNCTIPGIVDISTYNNRVVKVTFADGSFTRCVCQPDDAFDFDTGIMFCLFKRMLGKEDGHKMFNDMLRYAHKVIEKKNAINDEANKKKRAQRENRIKQEKKAQAKRDGKRREAIDIQREAFIEAMKAIKGE